MTRPSGRPSTGSSTGAPSAVREDARAKVTGAARYVSDLQLDGCLHAAIHRSEMTHARIDDIDIRPALAVPGVVGVLTAADLAGDDARFGEWVLDHPPLATDRIRFHGEPVAAVVARDPRTARAAARLVVLHATPLGTAATMEQALAGEAEPIHPVTELGPNVCARWEAGVGDVDDAFARADWVHDATYRFPAVYHFAMEPFTCLAWWTHDRLEVWTATQEPFRVRSELARCYGLTLDRVRLHVPFIGGSYGSRTAPKYEPLTAALARKVGRPVRLATDLHEAFLTNSRHGARVHVRTAIDGTGGMIARETTIDYDTGAYADKGPRVAKKGAYRAAGPYRIPHVRSVARAIYTNHLPAGAFRGFSTPQVVWASESAIDEIAAHLDMDPLAYRLRHLRSRGEPFLNEHDTPLDTDLAVGLGRAASSIGWGTRDGRGRGLAVGVKDGGGAAGRSEATVRLHPDGSLELITATTEIGQGSRSVFRRLVADTLDVAVEAVSVVHVDTDLAPHDAGTGASRSTIAVGSAVEEAALQLRSQLTELASGLSTGGVTSVGLRGSHLTWEDETGPRRARLDRTIATALGLEPAELGPLVARGVHEVHPAPGALGSSAPFYEVSHGAAVIELDRETGEIHLRQYTSVADVGHALDRNACEGQDEGAVVMGLGHTLWEALEFSATGELLNGAMFEYRVPRASDVASADMRTIFVEERDGPGPGGAKGVGEGGIIPIAPAVANALAAATGVRVRDLPLTPERVWRALASDHD